jgi:hypothetical protein
LDEVVASRLLSVGAQVLIEASERASERRCVTGDGPGLLVSERLPGALPLGLSEGGAASDLEPECSGECLLGLRVEDGRGNFAVRPRILPERPDEGGDGVLGESDETRLRDAAIERSSLGHLNRQQTEEGLAAAQCGLNPSLVE